MALSTSTLKLGSINAIADGVKIGSITLDDNIIIR